MFLSLLHDLLREVWFVATMSAIWLFYAFSVYRETRIPAVIGISFHAILLTAPFLAVSSHGPFDLPADLIAVHAVAASLYVALFAHRPPPKG